MRIPQIFKTANTTTIETSYQDACIASCATEAGAYALSDQLAELEKAAIAGGPRRGLYRRQKEAAYLAAGHARLKHDLATRIPGVLQSAETQSQQDLSEATDALTAAEQEVTTRKAKLDAYTAQHDVVEKARQEVIDAAQAALRSSQRTLDAARESEDLAAVEQAAVALHEANQALVLAQTEQQPQAIRLQAVASMVLKATGEFEAALAAAKVAQKAQQQTEIKIAQLASDRAALGALASFVEWYRTVAALGSTSLLQGAENNGFFFHEAEHAPFWRDGHGPKLFVPVRDAGPACLGPNWQVFQTDPATLQESEAAPDQPDQQSAWLAGLNAQIDAKNAALIPAMDRVPQQPGPRVIVASDPNA